jgi:hypothetical protein
LRDEGAEEEQRLRIASTCITSSIGQRETVLFTVGSATGYKKVRNLLGASSR